MMIARVVQLRNREKGHRYTGEMSAQVMAELLEPALHEYLGAIPVLTDWPLVG